MVRIIPRGKRLCAKEDKMKPDLCNRFRSPGKLAFSSFIMILLTLLPMPQAWSKGPNEKKTKQETQKTEAKKRTRGKKKLGLLENPKVTIEVGGRVREVKGDRPGKFEENRDFPKGFFVRNFEVKFDTPDSPTFLTFKGLEIGERDVRYSAEIRMLGKYRGAFLWDQLPKYYSDGRTFHLAAEPGFLAVNPDIRARLQAAPNSGAAASQLGPQLPLQAQQEVQNQATENLRVSADQLLVTQSYKPTKNWEFFFAHRTYVSVAHGPGQPERSRMRTRGQPAMSFGRQWALNYRNQ